MTKCLRIALPPAYYCLKYITTDVEANPFKETKANHA